MTSRIVLAGEAGAASQYLSELRDIDAQKDRARFRQNLRRIGWEMALRIAPMLAHAERIVQTPHGPASCQVLSAQPVLATIMRAGLPFHEGFLDIFDRADCSFIGASRAESGIDLGYTASGALDGRVLILTDPMLATGNSILQALSSLKRFGTWSALHVCSVIASAEARDFLYRSLPDAHIWIGAVDQTLNQKKEIVPGLGDAGDLCFGEKIKPS
jgi:uracil phosphoribosyltransferase